GGADLGGPRRGGGRRRRARPGGPGLPDGRAGGVSAEREPSLNVRGRWPLPAGPRVAIVGARRPTPYGEAVAERLAADLAAAGAAVVSGLALGVDAAAHEGALEAGGCTIAVLGTGVDVIYPAAHVD